VAVLLSQGWLAHESHPTPFRAFLLPSSAQRRFEALFGFAAILADLLSNVRLTVRHFSPFHPLFSEGSPAFGTVTELGRRRGELTGPNLAGVHR
jgi:hypothetical protein